MLEALARATLTLDARASRPATSALAVVAGAEVYVDLEGVVDVSAERARLTKEITRTAEAVAFTRAKLARPDFVERAPEEIVDKEQQKLAEQEALHAKLVASLGWISGDGAAGAGP
jgi:valyl-tRNA synthetase